MGRNTEGRQEAGDSPDALVVDQVDWELVGDSGKKGVAGPVRNQC